MNTITSNTYNKKQGLVRLVNYMSQANLANSYSILTKSSNKYYRISNLF